MNINRCKIMLAVLCLGFCSQVAGEEKKGAEDRTITLEIDDFVKQATARDTEFEAILLDGLKLRYEKDLRLPARDIVVSLKQEHQAYLSQDRSEGATEVSLSKLFPLSGTELSASYEIEPRYNEDGTESSVSLSIAQPIARNAFGRSTRLLDKIIGLETEVARYQVVEAYEDYLAGIMVAYQSWYEAYENLAIAQSSYKENLKLLENIKERQKKQVARPIDVNKIELQVLARRENIIELEEDYNRRLRVIERVIRHEGDAVLVPAPSRADDVSGEFEEAFKDFVGSSRTFRMLRLLEEKSGLEVDREADDLLPSLELFVNYDVLGEEERLDESEDRVSVGLELEWPFPDQVDDAELETAKIDLRQAELSRLNARHRLYEDVGNLYNAIRREKRLIELTSTKIKLARSVLEDETENYSYGRVTLNDYISAVNVLDANRFSEVLHETRYKKLVIEWYRLTDQLIRRKDIVER